jgi:hypothetical protein
MSITNLTGQKTSKTYQNLLQVSSSGALFNGTGSAVQNLSVTSSYAISASYAATASYAVTSSYALTASYATDFIVSRSISNVDYIDFDTGSVQPGWKSGRVFWDNTDGALSVYNAEVDVTLQVGQENWTRVSNRTGATILNGTVVRLSGAHGDVPEVERAQSVKVSGSVNLQNQILGVATHDIETDSKGYITTQGLVRGVNTNAFNEGDTLFVGTGSAGGIQNVPPVAPYEIIPIGVCVKAGPGGSGIIYVAVQEPIDFSDLSSALVDGTYSYGDLWTFKLSGSSGVWAHTNQLSGSYGITGSLNITQGVTGSLFGTASWARNVASSSFATSASFALTASYLSGYASAFPFNGNAVISGSLTVTGSVSVTQGITGSLFGTSSWSINAISSSYTLSSSFAESTLSSISSSFATTALNAPAYLPLTGGTITGNLTVIGTASFAYTTASIVQVGSSVITLNTDNPATRFGGITVVDSGSFGNSSTGSLFWDSQNNRWIYANPSGSTYDGGMLISGPRNTSGLGNETGMDRYFVAVGQGADHIQPSTIFNSGSGANANTIVTGSLMITAQFRHGLSTTATGLYSHAEGVSTVASGQSSHAEGESTQATETNSHAEGFTTTASGINSHAEGNQTQAIGENSHAEGSSTRTIGESSHAEGYLTITTGASSHAEGANTFTGFRNSVNIDQLTDVSGVSGASSSLSIIGYNYTSQYTAGTLVDIYDDGFGFLNSDTIFSSSYNANTTTVFLTNTDTGIYVGFMYVMTPGIHGNYAHAEGASTVAAGNNSHAEGANTLALGDASHAEGSSTQAIGSYSHAEGLNTQAQGYSAHAEGYYTIAQGNYSHAEGYGTIASGDYQHVQGKYNISSSIAAAFIIGNGLDNNTRSNLVFASGSQFQVTGSVIATQGFTGSLFGTASWANNAVSSSFATTALIAPDYLQLSSTSSMLESYVLNSSTSSFVQNAQTSSMLEPYVLNSVTSSMSVLSSSFATTASYALNAGGSGGGTNLGLVVAISLGYQNLF